MTQSFSILIIATISLSHCRSWGKFWATELLYPQNPLLLTQSVAMAPVTPSLPGAPASCSVTPALPEGLSLANDCTISGTPTRGQGALSYRITVGENGALTAIPGSPFTTGKNPIGITFDETSRFVYIIGSGETNPTPDPVYAYQLNLQTGAISLAGTYAAGVDATSIAVAGSNP